MAGLDRFHLVKTLVQPFYYLVERCTDTMKQTCEEEEPTRAINDIEWAYQNGNHKLHRRK